MKSFFQIFTTLSIIFLFSCKILKERESVIIKDLAILIEKDCDSLKLLKGHTYELEKTLEIKKPIVIIGNGATIQLNNFDHNIFRINSDNVKISDVHFVGPAQKLVNQEEIYLNYRNPSYDKPIKKDLISNCGILVNAFSNIEISKCSISNCIGSGIFLHGSKNIKLLENKLFDNIFVFMSSDIGGSKKGKEYLDNILVEGNNCQSNNRTGINLGTFGGIRNITINSNTIITKTFTSNLKRAHGIQVLYGKKKERDFNNSIVITNNKIEMTTNTGIYIGSNGDVEVSNNTLSNIALNDKVSISGGILIVNDSNAEISSNKISNFRGSFENRGAIATFGGNKDINTGKIEIKKNVIEHATNGITVDQHLSNVEINENSLFNIESKEILIQYPFNSRPKNLPSIIVRDNLIISNEFKNFGIYLNSKVPLHLNIHANLKNGLKTSFLDINK